MLYPVELRKVLNMAKRTKSRIEKLLATRMKRLRSIDGMNQIEAAELMGMKSASYSDIEACNKNINLNQLETIANGYRVTMGFLLEGTEEGIEEERLQQIKSSIEFA